LNFLIKLEDAINKILLIIWERIKALLPHFLFEIIPAIQHFFHNIPHLIKENLPKLKIKLFIFIGHIKQTFSVAIGYFTAFSIFLRTEEFKKNKFTLIIKPYQYCKKHPYRAITKASILSVFSVATFIIFSNTQTVIQGTKKARTPASVQLAELINENEIELKNKKFEVAIKAAAGGHGGGGAAHHEVEIMLDIKIEATNKENKEFIEEMEEKLDDDLEAFEFQLSGLPLSDEERAINEKALFAYVNQEFFHLVHENIIKKIAIKQSPIKRPEYFDREGKTFGLQDLSLQIFLEDTKRNTQVLFDFSLLASNRNIVLFLKDNEVKIRDRLSTQIEPILPRLPIEDEGKLILKDKIRAELNEMLKEEKIEGKVLEIYLEHIIGS
jgi:hypothetical protein